MFELSYWELSYLTEAKIPDHQNVSFILQNLKQKFFPMRIRFRIYVRVRDSPKYPSALKKISWKV